MDKAVRGRVALSHYRQVAEGALRGTHPHRLPHQAHQHHHHPNKVLGGLWRHRGGRSDHRQKYREVSRIRLCE